MKSKRIVLFAVFTLCLALLFTYRFDETKPPINLATIPINAEISAKVSETALNARMNSPASHSGQSFGCRLEDYVDEAERPDYAEQVSRLRERSDRAVAGLSESESAEHLFVASSMPYSSKSSRYDMRLLNSALKKEPSNPQFHWHRLNACNNGLEHVDCRSTNIEIDAIDADPKNGAIWTLIAKRRALRGDTDGVFDAVKEIAMSPRFDGFYADDLKSYERSLAAVTNLSYVERVDWGMSRAVILLSSSSNVFEICKPYIEVSEEWRAQCLQAAEATIRGNSSILHSQMALELQRLIYEYSGDVNEWNATTRRIEQIRETLDRSTSTDIQLVLSVDERVLATFIEELGTHGELTAMEYSYEEVERLKLNPQYDPCQALRNLWERRNTND